MQPSLKKECPDNTPYDFNTLVLVDAEEQAFAVLCTQQDTLYKVNVTVFS
ncbi:Uncharacterised protein [Escherichia coli]|nr:Uncharacterised protein [Escherichia coli]